MAAGIIKPGVIFEVNITVMENGRVELTGPLNDPIALYGVLRLAEETYSRIRAKGDQAVLGAAALPPNAPPPPGNGG